MKINLLNIDTKNKEISLSEGNCLKNKYFQKSVYKKEQKFTDLNKEILSKQDIISNIQKNIESQMLINEENKELTTQLQNPNFNPLYQKYEKYKKKIGKILRNKNLIGLYSLRKRKSVLDFNGDKEQIYNNLILSPIKLNNVNKRKTKKYFSQIMRNNSFYPILNSNRIINNIVSNKEKNRKEFIKINIMNNTDSFVKRKNSELLKKEKPIKEIYH